MSAQVRLQDTWLLLCAAAGVLIGDSQYVMDTEHTDAEWHSLSLFGLTSLIYWSTSRLIDPPADVVRGSSIYPASQLFLI